MPKRALTAAAVERLKPPQTGQVDHFDAGYPGLALRISYGGRRAWVFVYRLHGKQRRMSLGTYPALGLKDAREAWREARAKVERGLDPGAERLEAKRKPPETVQAAAEEFIARYCRPRLRTADEIARMFELHVYPEIGRRPIETITRRDILRMLDRAEARGAGVRVNRILAVVRRFFNWAVERGMIETTPVDRIKAPAKEVARDRVLSDDELRAFLRACDAVGGRFGPLFRLLLLTAQRREEVSAAQWSEIDLQATEWSLPGERVKNGRAHVVPLSEQALEIIRALPRQSKDPFLFPAAFARRKDGPFPPRPVSGFGQAKKRLDAAMLLELRKMAEERGEDPDDVTLPPWRLHDLRRTAASGMARLGVAVHVVERLLNHVSGTISGIAAVYNRHSYREEMRAAAQAWANFLDGLSDERAENVVALRSKPTEARA
ncbi:MAG: tyrosine-type recombinase/integrase [Pseudomonadota bacterium]